jgi:preprotein translocase subunit SecE
VARNRKRAKERRAQRPQPTATGARGDRAVDPIAAPDPLAHATPDGELADAQLAVGRPELASEPDFDAEREDAALEAVAAGGSGGDGDDLGEEGFGEDDEDSHRGGVPAAPAPSGNRLVNFIQGSWRELQRVQWPDRRQVVQATGVVIGFVIVAGLYLGAADWVAGKIVNLIIK